MESSVLDIPFYYWIVFNGFVLIMLALDLGVFHKKNHVVSFKESLIWTSVWITLALLFNVGVFYTLGKQPALEFFTGYVIEKALSVDNIFIFLMIFSFFNIPRLYQHRVLFYGILGALIMRAIFIFAGVALINKFHWIIYVFGVFLIITGIKMLKFDDDAKIEPDKNPIIKLFKKIFPVTPDLVGDKFFIRQGGKLIATPLMVTLVFVEISDLIFAVDSIPAILAITREPFLVYTSNVFAILGLRSLYFCLAGFMGMFRYLGVGLAAILTFIGVKMLIIDIYKIPILASLGTIVTILAIAVIASIIAQKRNPIQPELPGGPPEQ